MSKPTYLFTIPLLVISIYFLVSFLNAQQEDLVVYTDINFKTENNTDLKYIVEQVGEKITYYKFKEPYDESGSIEIKNIKMNVPRSLNFLDDTSFESKYVTVTEIENKISVHFGYTEGCIGQNVCSYLSYSEIKASNMKLLEQQLLDSLEEQKVSNDDNADFLEYLNGTKIENFTFNDYDVLFHKQSCSAYCPAGAFYVQVANSILFFQSKSFTKKEDVVHVLPMVKDLWSRR